MPPAQHSMQSSARSCFLAILRVQSAAAIQCALERVAMSRMCAAASGMTTEQTSAQACNTAPCTTGMGCEKCKSMALCAAEQRRTIVLKRTSSQVWMSESPVLRAAWWLAQASSAALATKRLQKVSRRDSASDVSAFWPPAPRHLPQAL